MTYHTGNQQGFTLIEVMIAIAIMATIATLSWRGLDGMTRANAQLQARTEATERLLHTLQQLERDVALRTTIELPSPIANSATAPEGNAVSENNAASDDTRIRLLPAGITAFTSTPKPFQLEVIRTAPADPGRWQRVRWWLQDGKLYRAAGTAAANYPLPVPHHEDRVVVLSNVATFEVRAWEPGVGWRQLSVSSLANTAATGLEVRLSLTRNTDAVATYRRVFSFE